MIFLDANPLIALVDKLWTYDSEFRVVWRRRTALGSRWLSRNGDRHKSLVFASSWLVPPNPTQPPRLKDSKKR